MITNYPHIYHLRNVRYLYLFVYLKELCVFDKHIPDLQFFEKLPLKTLSSL